MLPMRTAPVANTWAWPPGFRQLAVRVLRRGSQRSPYIFLTETRVFVSFSTQCNSPLSELF